MVNLTQIIVSRFRSDPETTAKLSRTGQSLVTLEQAVAVSTQIGAECYVETKALVSGLETHEVCHLLSPNNICRTFADHSKNTCRICGTEEEFL